MNRELNEQSVESSLFSRGSSWNEDDVEDDDQGLNHGPYRPRGLSFSEHQQQIDSESVESILGGPSSSHPPKNSSAAQNNVSTEQERQILLLMLLAQVCALHDPTPRTFTVHVLELFERGILDRQSIHFLFELGLVPSLNVASRLLTAPPPSSPTSSPPTTPSKNNGQLIQSHGIQQRSIEVSAIRSTLEQQESIGNELSPTKTAPTDATAGPNASWSAEHHPLSLSRYQREFDQIALLSSGSFGQVFHATNKTDGQNYAVKRVPFNATGYSKDSVQQVTREVQCLAACDHPYVVRYYTSWLEPSWMTGSGGKAPVIPTHTRLLTDGSSSFPDQAGEHEESEDLLDYFRNSKLYRKPSRRRRRFSFDNSDRSASWCPPDGDSSEEEDDDDDGFKVGECHSVPSDDDSDIFERSRPAEQESVRDDSYLDDLFGRGRPRKKKAKQQPAYRYQICLFIQMQLCHPSTLADWIRARNRQMEESTLSERLRPALQIFDQICSGLAHVHHKGIVHRDLKPANIFASQDGSSFLIGDFGLSKLLQTTNKGRTGTRQYKEDRLLLMYEPCNSITKEEGKESVDEPSWRDPLTAGVGTASYASPEQVASKTYGKEADIFSVGLILLELLCCFCTEHERIQTFHDCRYRRDLPDDIKKIPSLANTILQCTDKCPENRPSAESLRKFALVSLSAESSLGSLSDQGEESEVERLKRKLSEKESEVDGLKALLAERDRAISELRQQVSTLRIAAIQNKSTPFQSSRGEVILPPRFQPSSEGDASSSRGSSSEDEL